MLQAYHFDMSQLYEDYRDEFHRDMATLESLISASSNEGEDQESKFSDADGDTLTFDPTSGVQRWRKTEDGWEREDIPDDDTTAETPQEENDPAPAWAKKLYKKIALVTHPDRTSADPRKEKLNKVFADSARAMSEGDYEKLLGYALDLDLDIMSDDVDSIPLIKKRISDIKQEITTIEGSLEWLWGESLELPDIRAGVAKVYLQGKGFTINIEDAAAMIKTLENSSAKDREG